MKKISLLMVVLFGVSSLAFAQQYPGKGTIDINGGIGLGHNLSGSGGMPINLAVDYGINEEVSVGGYVGYLSSKENFGTGEWKYSNLIVGGRATYHKEFVEDIDTYGGIILGYNAATAEWNGPGNATASAGGIVYQGFVGARYHFTESLGAYGELGFGIAVLQLGLTFRL